MEEKHCLFLRYVPYIVSERWCSDQVDSVADSSQRVISTAAKLIATQIHQTIMTKNGIQRQRWYLRTVQLFLL